MSVSTWNDKGDVLMKRKYNKSTQKREKQIKKESGKSQQRMPRGKNQLWTDISKEEFQRYTESQRVEEVRKLCLSDRVTSKPSSIFFFRSKCYEEKFLPAEQIPPQEDISVKKRIIYRLDFKQNHGKLLGFRK